MMLNHLRDGLVSHMPDERGVVSIDWILLAIIVMVAVIVAFAPQFQTAVTAGIQAVSSTLSAQTASAGS